MLRVLVAGGTGFRDYARLRDTLDSLLADRLPDVIILTAGGPGVPALAASYARSRGLEVRVTVADSTRKNQWYAREEQLAALVAASEAVVVVAEPGCDAVIGLACRMRRPLHLLDPSVPARIRTSPDVPSQRPSNLPN